MSASGSRTSLTIDGSSTVYPVISAIGDDFAKANPSVSLTINKSGTGSGFQKFERGEIDIAAASRTIEPKELETLRAAHREFLEVPFAYDGVTVIVSKQNDWVDRMTLEELKKAWSPNSPVSTWANIRTGWPDQKIQFYSPTDNHGTYSYFTEAINQEEGAMRKDVQTNQDYNAIVQAIADDKYGIGYVGLSYYFDNRDKVKEVAVDSGNGPIDPNQQSISNGIYSLLSRPLFLYIDKRSFDRKPAVRNFVRYVMSSQGSADVAEAHYVQIPATLVKAVQKRIASEQTGSLFSNSISGLSVAYVLKRESAAP